MNFSNRTNLPACPTPANAPGDEMGRGSGADRGPGGALVRAHPKNASEGRFSGPPDLQAFLAAQPLREAARQLGLARGTVDRLRRGYWPANARRILRAWAEYKGRAPRASGWFIRVVRSDGTVTHGARLYGGPGLGSRVGERVAVARSHSGGLMVQTLDEPMERYALELLEPVAP